VIEDERATLEDLWQFEFSLLQIAQAQVRRTTKNSSAGEFTGQVYLDSNPFATMKVSLAYQLAPLRQYGIPSLTWSLSYNTDYSGSSASMPIIKIIHVPSADLVGVELFASTQTTTPLHSPLFNYATLASHTNAALFTFRR
jgi:hypothetical protein